MNPYRAPELVPDSQNRYEGNRRQDNTFDPKAIRSLAGFLLAMLIVGLVTTAFLYALDWLAKWVTLYWANSR
tara:strand:+ start:224 stop:439 length:216 start_codon:yes stop_codon:yes gene_type:complete